MFAVSTVLAALVFYIKSQHSPYPIGFRPCEMLQCPQDQSQAPSSPGQSAANPENPSKNPKKRISPSLTTEGGHLKRPTSPIFKNCFSWKNQKSQACKRPGIPKASNCLGAEIWMAWRWFHGDLDGRKVSKSFATLSLQSPGCSEGREARGQALSCCSLASLQKIWLAQQRFLKKKGLANSWVSRVTSSLSAKGEKEKLGVLGVLESEPKGCVQTPKQEQKNVSRALTSSYDFHIANVLLILDNRRNQSAFPLPGSPAPGHTGPWNLFKQH